MVQYIGIHTKVIYIKVAIYITKKSLAQILNFTASVHGFRYEFKVWLACLYNTLAIKHSRNEPMKTNVLREFVLNNSHNKNRALAYITD